MSEFIEITTEDVALALEQPFLTVEPIDFYEVQKDVAKQIRRLRLNAALSIYNTELEPIMVYRDKWARRKRETQSIPDSIIIRERCRPLVA